MPESLKLRRKHHEEITGSERKLRGYVRILIVQIRTKLLLAGIELKIFNHLSEPKTADTVAKAIESRPGNTRHFPGGLVANDPIRKEGDPYQNTAVTQEFLVESSLSETGFGTKMPTDSGRFLRQIFQKMPPHSESQNNIVPRPQKPNT